MEGLIHRMINAFKMELLKDYRGMMEMRCEAFVFNISESMNSMTSQDAT